MNAFRQPWVMSSRARRKATLALLIATVGLSSACAAPLMPPPIVSKAQLGQVIIYRNGVAYFERYAPPGEKELTLRVPAERVDDFLKSLTIIDDKTGETMPASYPTPKNDGGEVEMTIKLPPQHNGLRISYVTESPAWKPSYRLVLGRDGEARLQGWAIVDNVSGEDWKDVRIGVGSTSALSFRFDLHSVREVQRETLSHGSLLAAAPPTGGSTYRAADGKKAMLLANIDHGLVDEFQRHDDVPSRQRATATKTPPTGANVGRVADSWAEKSGERRSRRGRGDRLVASLAHRLKKNKQRVRIEGFAKAPGAGASDASLRNANALRDKLIQNGVPAEQVEAVGTGQVRRGQAAQVVQLGAESDRRGTKFDGQGPGTDASAAPLIQQPLGQAHFVSSEAMTIERDHSAMVSIVNADTRAQRVYYYDPISARGAKRFAFNAVRFDNPSRYTLDSGPFTVYAAGQFLGEGLSEPILPHASAFIPYALDRKLLVEPQVVGREEIDKLITIQRGIVSTESRRIRLTKLNLVNRGAQEAMVYVRHKVATGYKLAKNPGLKISKLGGAHLFSVKLGPKQTRVVEVQEWTPIHKTVDIRTSGGVKAIGLYLAKAKLDPKLSEALREIVAKHRTSANFGERAALLSQQMAVYRERVNEINFQLVTLRKVRQAARLRRHLTLRMEEISEKLQKATIDLTELKGAQMTLNITLQDKLAELTLREDSDNPLQKKAEQKNAAKKSTAKKITTRKR